MNKTILKSFLPIAAIAASAIIGCWARTNAHVVTSNVTLDNIEAFRNSKSLDCEYVNEMSECRIYVGAKGKIKLLGGSIIEAGADGYVCIDGRVVCRANGDATCSPVECNELYETILK